MKIYALYNYRKLLDIRLRIVLMLLDVEFKYNIYMPRLSIRSANEKKMPP